MIKGGLSRGIVYLCWPGMVPNQSQLFIVVSDWGPYLGSHMLWIVCGLLSMASCMSALVIYSFTFVLYSLFKCSSFS